MKIDTKKLKKDLKEESYGAGFVGGFGGAFAEANEIDRASDEKVVDIALSKGVDLSKYEE